MCILVHPSTLPTSEPRLSFGNALVVYSEKREPGFEASIHYSILYTYAFRVVYDPSVVSELRARADDRHKHSQYQDPGHSSPLANTFYIVRLLLLKGKNPHIILIAVFRLYR